ncbi:Phage Tail Collar Domain protein [compost metagenome]
MANLQEVVSWETGIYQLETGDPVLGGPGGISNKQAQALANRTAYLKKHVDDLEGGTRAAGKADKLSTARNIALAGDVTGQAAFDGSGNITVTYKNSGVVAGTYRSVTVDAKGNITAGSNPTTLAGYGITDALPASGTAAAANKLATARTIALAGDVTGQAAFDGSGNITITATYKNSGVVAGTYRSVTVDAKGNITGGTNPTTLAGYGITDAATKTEQASSEYPVGAPIPWPLAAPPSGYLMCMGQSFNKATYPKLAGAYPSGVLPDLRGEFIRGRDNARGIDTGRVLLASQSDAIRNITGAVGFTDEDASNALKALASGAFSIRTGTLKPSMMGTTGTPSASEYIADFDASTVVPTAPENRPCNIAFNYIVRAA